MRTYRFKLILTVVLLLICMAAALMIGTYRVGFYDLFQMLTSETSKMVRIVIFDLRLPRICLAVGVGMALASSGCILQTITKNELAEPGVIGINAGAALAVTLLISASTGAYYEKLGSGIIYMIPFAAIVGAFVTTAMIYFLSYRKGVSPVRLLLVGIGVNSAVNAFITLYQLNMSKGDYNQVLTWINGSLWGTGWKYVVISAPIILLLLVVFVYKAKTLDVLALGDAMAHSLGVNVTKERRVFLILAVAFAGVATAVAGNITFLGILGPQIAKRLVGSSHRRQIPMAALISAVIIVAADTVARNLFSPLELPVGIAISVLGVPYFIYLMVKAK